ncbi:MAG: cytochrome c oxidase assembly factor Coa1 family protein [Psychroserpens sp.]|uniref:cytochrome c oxidase assembly factor Coa1 family protein n=1 Tax=Psychroserpens sp. TaxID=2020870 RepID=UPI003C73DBEE
MTANIRKPWWRHWKWLIPLTVLSLAVFTFFASGMGGAASQISRAYTEETLYTEAIARVNANLEVIHNIGTIQPIDKLAILEGSVIYTNDNTHIETSVRITGDIGKGKMDIVATKKEHVWHYDSIKLRVTKPQSQKRTIQIVPFFESK